MFLFIYFCCCCCLVRSDIYWTIQLSKYLKILSSTLRNIFYWHDNKHAAVWRRDWLTQRSQKEVLELVCLECIIFGPEWMLDVQENQVYPFCDIFN